MNFVVVAEGRSFDFLRVVLRLALTRRWQASERNKKSPPRWWVDRAQREPGERRRPRRKEVSLCIVLVVGIHRQRVQKQGIGRILRGACLHTRYAEVVAVSSRRRWPTVIHKPRFSAGMTVTPKVFDPPAQRLRRSRYPGRRSIAKSYPERVSSVPDIAFVEIDPIAFEQCPNFVLERNAPMMFLLSGNVLSHRFDLRCADRESAVSALPSEVRECRRSCFDPER